MEDKKIQDIFFLECIERKISKHIAEVTSLGVASGISGVMIFYFLLSKLLKCDQKYEKAKSLIQKGIMFINNGYNDPLYSNGITGFLWTLQFLNENDIIEIDDDDDFFCQIEDFIYKVMTNDIENKNYDFLHGAIGYGVFFLKRYKTTKNPVLRNRYKDIMCEVVEFLGESKIENIKGFMWESPQESDIGNEINIDLGLAHGVPSILYFLCLVYDEGVFKEKIHPLIEGACNYVLSTKNVSKNIISLFPTYQYVSQIKEEHASRLGWCYGDVGVGLSLLKAAKVTNDIILKNEAISILIHSSKRRGLGENSVLDAGLCHGAYGLFHIYGKLFKKTKEQSFRESSEYWKMKGDNMAKFDENKNIDYEIYLGERNWLKPISLLEGVTGIGLSIISGLNNYEIEWEECLFI
ncbi:lanthionine synthetase C family protein [Aquimarina algiphila]|uniref:lanthionine synthetase C family protein n=1 Tax=Aquimarina algiphila TaxID=2047982 RepID=UPI002491C926|nr:lanthionine synthetase C family protein [Aquimarina algiphila]